MDFSIDKEFDIEKVCQELSAFEGGTIDLRKDEETGIAIMTINNPTRRVKTSKMMVELRYALDELERWTTGKALIIYGAGGFFCSGGDLNMVKQWTGKFSDTSKPLQLGHDSSALKKGGYGMSELMKLNFNRLQNLSLITLCVVQGKAIGGGAELLTVCDFRLATRSSKIGFVHKKLGITTGWSGGVRLVNLVGKNKALDLMLFGRQLDAEEALNYGLINDIIEDNDQIDVILNEVRAWLSKYIDGSNATIKAIKTIVNAASNLSIEDALEVELKAFQSVWGAEAHQDAIKANIKHRT